jgi:hypothetical protein
MSSSPNPDRQATGLALAALAGNTPSTIFYIGVQTKYSANKAEVYEPVPIFSKRL